MRKSVDYRLVVIIALVLIAFITVAYVLRVQQDGTDSNVVLSSEQDTTTSKPAVKRQKRNVFFDFGANFGDSIESFVGNEGAIGGKGLTGLGKQGKWDIWGFEANPFFNEKLALLDQRLSAITLPSGEKQYNVYMKPESAITTKDGKVSFYLDTVNDGWRNFWGSSLLANHRDVVQSEKEGKKKIVTVDGYGISDLIMKNYDIDDYIVVKMDVEGVEYDLLIDMIRTGAIHYVDLLLCEYHDWIEPQPGLTKSLKYILSKMGVKEDVWT